MLCGTEYILTLQILINFDVIYQIHFLSLKFLRIKFYLVIIMLISINLIR